MKTIAKTFALALLVSAALLFIPSPKARQTAGGASTTFLTIAGVNPVGDRPLNDTETSQLNSIFSQVVAAANSVPPSPDAGAQRRAIDNELRAELESFVTNNPASAWTPSLHLLLARRAQLRCGYSLALDHYQAAFSAVAGSTDLTAQEIAREASGGLAKMLMLTGRASDFDALLAALPQFNLRPSGSDWGWAAEMRQWVGKHPNDSYKCGLYCLDQLGRVTQPGQFLPKNVTEIRSSTNGYTAADLLAIGGNAGLRLHAAFLTDTNNLPVPSILHLRSQHFIIVREQRGAFYNALDPVALGMSWLTLQDLAPELSGCVIVSDALPPAPTVQLVAMDSSGAAAYLGRCHDPIRVVDPGPWSLDANFHPRLSAPICADPVAPAAPIPSDHDDNPPCSGDDSSDSCPPPAGCGPPPPSPPPPP
ncbi:MAG TPA: cysteine peptidase family C39 domain-containing protein, partial [Candidatus Binatia bacterium]|nr:cysteine peptidase family C39 domain-containing protein [Candidatus Binatia bacterium]